MIFLLEPPRAPGFLSGGYRYQQAIGERLAASREGALRVASPVALADTVEALRMRDPESPIVIDGLFLAHGPLPGGTLALLHTLPAAPALAGLRGAIATGQGTAAAVAAGGVAVQLVRPGLAACFQPASAPRRPGPLRIACVGTVHSGKGQLELVRALRQLGADCELMLLGDAASAPDYAAAVRAAAKGITAEGITVQFAGVLPEAAVAATLQQADLLVSASRNESFGMAVAEAAAVGTPILAFATGEIASFVSDGGNGWLLPPDASWAEFAARLHELLRAPATLAAARQQARRPLLDPWDTVAQSFARASRALWALAH